MEYTIIKGDVYHSVQTEKFLEEVNTLCKKGWEPLGRPEVTNSGYISQAMIKKDPPCDRRGTLEFDLSTTYNEEEYRASLDGPRWKNTVFVIVEELLRRRWKHSEDEKEIQTAKKISEEIHSYLEDRGLSLYN